MGFQLLFGAKNSDNIVVANAVAYMPSYVQNDVVRALRTEKELKAHPYPTNVFTSCYYRYTDNKKEADKQIGQEGVTAFQWKATRNLFELRNLRPCTILQRDEDTGYLHGPSAQSRRTGRRTKDSKRRYAHCDKSAEAGD